MQSRQLEPGKLEDQEVLADCVLVRRADRAGLVRTLERDLPELV